MKREIIISGFGGQGVMSIGKNLVEAGMAEGFHVTWAPSYGPEMRGGTANCSVVLSSRPVGSPVFTHPTDLIAMNAPSIAKFGGQVVSGGLVLINCSVTEERLTRPDVRTVYVPCESIAYELGNPKAANMVMLGAYIAASGALKRETAEEMIRGMFRGEKAKLVPLNLEALQQGIYSVERTIPSAAAASKIPLHSAAALRQHPFRSISSAANQEGTAVPP